MKQKIQSSFDPWLTSQNVDLRASIGLTILASLLGKAIGFIRLQQIAATVGVGFHTDSLLIALQLVWLIETVLISSAVVPMIIARIYQVEQTEGGDSAVIFFMHAAVICSGFAIAATGLALIFSEQLTTAIAPGLDGSRKSLLIGLLWISAATPFALVLAHFLGLLNRLLQNGVWYSIPQIITNGTAIIGLMVGYYLIGADAASRLMMAGLSLGAILVCLIQLWVVPSSARSRLFIGCKNNFVRIFRFNGMWSFWSGVGTLAFVALTLELYAYMDFYFASRLEPGSISLLGFASRLGTLTLTLIVGSAFVILEPRWAKEVATLGSKAWSKVITPDIVSMLVIISIPTSILYVFPSEVTALVYKSNEYMPEARRQMIELTRIFSVGVVFLALDMITARAVVIANMQRWLFLTSLLLLPLKFVLSSTLMNNYGLAGLAIATNCVVLLQVLGNGLILMHANVPLKFRLIDVVCIGVIFISVLIVAKLIQINLGENIASLMLACIAITVTVLAIGKLFGLNFVDYIFKRSGLA